MCAILAALVWLRHWQNIGRLIRGQEPKIGGKGYLGSHGSGPTPARPPTGSYDWGGRAGAALDETRLLKTRFRRRFNR